MGVCLGDVFRGEVFVSEWRNERGSEWVIEWRNERKRVTRAMLWARKGGREGGKEKRVSE